MIVRVEKGALALEERRGLGVSSLPIPHVAESHVAPDELDAVGARLQRLLECDGATGLLLGPRQIPLEREEQGQLLAKVAVLGVVRERPGEDADTLVELPLPHPVGAGQRAPRHDVGGLELDRTREQGDGLVNPPEADIDAAHAGQRVHVAAVDGERAGERVDGPVEQRAAP